MNEKTFRVMEYEKIINMLASRAQSSMGKKMCLELKPSASIAEVREWLAETKEAFEIVL
jgi:DNA mismatch repair protein MutS2